MHTIMTIELGLFIIIIFTYMQKEEFFTGPGARQFVGVDEDYNDKVEVQPPDPGSSEWVKVFVQTKLYNKMLHQGTSFLYNCKLNVW